MWSVRLALQAHGSVHVSTQPSACRAHQPEQWCLLVCQNDRAVFMIYTPALHSAPTASAPGPAGLCLCDLHSQEAWPSSSVGREGPACSAAAPLQLSSLSPAHRRRHRFSRRKRATPESGDSGSTLEGRERAAVEVSGQWWLSPTTLGRLAGKIPVGPAVSSEREADSSLVSNRRKPEKPTSLISGFPLTGRDLGQVSCSESHISSSAKKRSMTLLSLRRKHHTHSSKTGFSLHRRTSLE